jgi:hypothetical protein
MLLTGRFLLGRDAEHVSGTLPEAWSNHDPLVWNLRTRVEKKPGSVS